MKKILLILIALLFGSGLAFSQEQWTLLNTSNSDIPSDRTISLGVTADDVVYIGTPGGLVDPSHVYEYTGTDWTDMDWFSSFNNMKSSPSGHLAIATGEGVFHYDGTEYVLFNKGNSNLTANNVSCLDIGPDGTEYIGLTAAGLVASGGLGIYDGSFWAIYNKDNSPLPVNNVHVVFIGQNNILWIGTQDAGLMKKDGDNWELFTTENSDIPENHVTHIAQSSSGLLWISFADGSIATFDGSEWTYIRVRNLDFPESNVSDMLFDADDNLWMGFESDGFAKYDGADWTYFTSLLTPLPGDEVTGLELDSDGKLWISTQWNGLAIYDPDFGSAIDDFLSRENIAIYPNPVNTSLNVEFTELTGKADLYIYNLMGQLLLHQQMNEAHFQIDCSKLQAGYYTLKIKSQKGNEFVSRPFVKQ
ncbi:MAG: hypothetical protein DRI89_06055 [Bacteroidetes bacterium]|nr:MAG: hypothetical protein DRI89_06055 [Bacteroidota bacterium]